MLSHFFFVIINFIELNIIFYDFRQTYFIRINGFIWKFALQIIRILSIWVCDKIDFIHSFQLLFQRNFIFIMGKRHLHRIILIYILFIWMLWFNWFFIWILVSYFLSIISKHWIVCLFYVFFHVKFHKVSRSLVKRVWKYWSCSFNYAFSFWRSVW